MLGVMDDITKVEFSNLVRFVKPSDSSNSKSCERQLLNPKSEQHLSGKEAALIYKDIISTPSDSTKCSDTSFGHSNSTSKHIKHRKRGQLLSKHTGDASNSKTFNIRTFLTSSENGDLTTVQKCLSNGVNVDSQDQFGWTALMCAACSGQSEVVQHLLVTGANVNLTASGGKTALSIASDAGHFDIVKLISEFDPASAIEIRTGRAKTSSSDSTVKEVEQFYCDICKIDVKETSQIQHQTSTVHLFNSKVKAKPHNFLEHTQNKGYQIMRRTGWDGEKGLGSEGQGQKFPIKTILRKDRACLGSDISKEKAKVTHFGPRDISAVNRNRNITERKMSVRTLSKRAHKAKERKQKQWEKNLRLQFNSTEEMF
ncbi:G patch domain and ankyrin repeat-containing protein 1 homolog [Argopecten irradians]|uniref:G patch domain and ankyrin repeat-containing protein 1 homolog n=1 Tax=Argopecten irradians TaxID=31199 RepID=UPI003715E140